MLLSPNGEAEASEATPATPGDPTLLERQAARAVIAASAALFVVLLLLLPARFQGSDEAKYLGIGLNVLRGHGAVTVYGGFFEPHSPLWPAIMAAPRAWFGLDAYAWAHLLNVASAGCVLVLGAVLGWRIRPAAGALTAVSVLAFPYVFDLSRRVGLDMPVALLTLGYLFVGWAAVRRGSVRLAIAAGAIFAVGFLVKETILPFAPVPFFAGLVWGRPASSIARTAAWTLLVAAVGTSWWWVLFAAETGRVYRVGTPAITLVPLGAGVLLAVALGLGWERIAAGILRWSARETSARRYGLDGRTAGWLLAVLWTLALTVFFSRTRELLGHGLFDPGQFGYYVGAWFDQMLLIVAVGGIGAAIDLASRVFAGRRPGPPVDDLWLASLCGLPLILLVVGVGDTPRHYVAQLVMLAAIGSGGWIWLIERAVERPTAARMTALVVAAAAAALVLAPLVLGRRLLLAGASVVVVACIVGAVAIARRADWRARSGPWLRRGGASALVVALAFVIGAGSLLARTTGTRQEASSDAAKAQAIATLAGWLRANMAPGSTIAFGSALGFENAVEVQDTFRVVQVRDATDILFSPTAPLGVVRQGRPPAGDWVTLDALSRTATTFTGYEAAPLIEGLRRSGADAWVLVTADEEDDPLVIGAALTADHGFDLLARWEWSTTAGTLAVQVYGLRRDALKFGPELWLRSVAFGRLVDQLEAASRSRSVAATAANLLERARVVPASADSGADVAALRVRLRQLAGR